ncbi:MAG: acylphosphatase [Pseudomonadota bacterium]
MTTRLVHVSGKVQHVGYRDWAVRTAQRLGVKGWVRNLRDGRVEILAMGEETALDEMVEACREGPQSAQVDRVDAAPADPVRAMGFTKRFTA